MSPEFARGVQTFHDLFRALPLDDPDRIERDAIVEMLMSGHRAAGDRLSDCSAGFAAALADCVAFFIKVGTPDPDSWRPLHAEPLFDENDYPRPPLGAELFEFEGRPTAIALDQTVFVFSGDDYEEHSDDALHVAVRREGQPIDRAAFDAMRGVASFSRPTAARQETSHE
jgi:hypothetical protein